MSDIRLKSVPFELDGKTYMLRCNMNVLADVQEAYGGDLTAALDTDGTLKSVLHFASAMLNDYADEMGWPERFTPRALGRKIALSELPSAAILSLVVSAVRKTDGEDEKDNKEKN